jgi:hypothetical protein
MGSSRTDSPDLGDAMLQLASLDRPLLYQWRSRGRTAYEQQDDG